MIGAYIRWTTTIALFTCAAITIPANIVILFYLKNGAKESKTMKSASSIKKDKSDDIKITCILLSISFIFFFFTIPNRCRKHTTNLKYFLYSQDSCPPICPAEAEPARGVCVPNLDQLPCQGGSELCLLLLCFSGMQNRDEEISLWPLCV